jgi:hypothetical protein
MHRFSRIGFYLVFLTYVPYEDVFRTHWTPNVKSRSLQNASYQ